MCLNIVNYTIFEFLIAAEDIQYSINLFKNSYSEKNRYIFITGFINGFSNMEFYKSLKNK